MRENIYQHICHLTSGHVRNDVRIFYKEMTSLKKTGCQLSLVVADGMGDENAGEIQIYDIGKPSGRINRWLKTRKKIYKKAIELDADIYHFHDPELISTGKKLANKGKTVIYDVHEDTPRQILNKPYLSKFIAKIISGIFERFENRSIKYFSCLVCATPFIRKRFEKIHSNAVDVNNFPLLSEFDTEIDAQFNENTICYVGGISVVRGLETMIRSLEYIKTDVKLHMAGYLTSEDSGVFEDLKKLDQWKKVEYHGFVDRKGVSDIIRKSKTGLVLLKPLPNYLDSLPIKMFEYMAAGVPVIASDFPYWKSIVEENHCGLTADPLNPQEVAEKIQYLLDKPEIAREMGANGKKAVKEKFNWGIEEKKLIDIYNSLLR